MKIYSDAREIIDYYIYIYASLRSSLNIGLNNETIDGTAEEILAQAEEMADPSYTMFESETWFQR